MIAEADAFTAGAAAVNVVPPPSFVYVLVLLGSTWPLALQCGMATVRRVGSAPLLAYGRVGGASG